MTVVNQNSVYEVIIKGQSQGQAILNILHYIWEPLSPPAPGHEVETFFTNFVTAWRANVLPMLHNGYTISEYILRQISSVIVNPTPPPPRIFTVPFTLSSPGSAVLDVGARAGDALPTYAAAGYRKRTSSASRNFRGGLRLSPLLETDTTPTGNSLSAAALGILQASNLTPLILLPAGGAPPNNLTLTVFSKTLALAAVTAVPSLHARPVTSFTLNTLITSQVSRKQSPGVAA